MRGSQHRPEHSESMFASVLRRREFLVGAAACLGAAALGRPLSAQPTSLDGDPEVSADHAEDFRQSLTESIDSRRHSNWTDVGYRRGDAPIPYGTRHGRVLRFGPGRHEIRDKIVLRSRQVLRGAGLERTTLYFPEHLIAMGYPPWSTPPRGWDWWGGVIEARGREIGIEDLTIEFPVHRYRHHAGQGYNGPDFLLAEDCWIRNVAVINADVGLLFRGARHCTAQDLRIVANQKGCHIHIGISGSTEILVTNFEVENDSIHGLTGNWNASRCVFSSGTLTGPSGCSLVIEPNHNGDRDTLDPTLRSGGRTEEFLYTDVRAPAIKHRFWPSNTTFWNVGPGHHLTPQNLYEAQMLAFKGRAR